MTQAFNTNLRALGLLALLVGLFLVYGTMSFAIVQRRRSLGILRALGATRAQLLRIILLEATGLALVGACWDCRRCPARPHAGGHGVADHQ